MAKVRTGLAKHGDAWFAMAQVKGRGQRGKTWITEPGTNIICTLVLRIQGLELHQQFGFNAAVALGVRDFFSVYAGEETTIKWPNDLYWRDRKAGGVLIENIIGGKDETEAPGELSELRTAEYQLPTNGYRLSTHPWQWAIVGMGININQTQFPENIRNAVSLKQITGKSRDAVALAKELIVSVQHRYEQLIAGHDLVKLYNEHLFKKDALVKFKAGSRVFEGRVDGINNAGELIVHTGIEEHFRFGELEWVL